MSLIITNRTLEKMDLCGNHHAKNAIQFVGELREITVGNILCALEQGVDVLYFIDYWLREDAGKGLGVGPKGKVPDHLLWIYDEMMEDLNVIHRAEKLGLGRSQNSSTDSQRAHVYHRALECLWLSKRWAL